MNRISFFCCLVLTALLLSDPVSANDTVIVRKDGRLDVLTAKQTQINKHASLLTSTGQYKGFRVQVVSTSNREQAFKVKAELLAKYPDQKSYTLFQSPNFKVRIGNFLKKEDAEKFKIQLSKVYNTGVFVIEDAIDYKPSKEEEEQINQ